MYYCRQALQIMFVCWILFVAIENLIWRPKNEFIVSRRASFWLCRVSPQQRDFTERNSSKINTSNSDGHNNMILRCIQQVAASATGLPRIQRIAIGYAVKKPQKQGGVDPIWPVAPQK
jgi:hypothetical protein